MNKDQYRRVSTPSPYEHCVAASCAKVGVSTKEAQKMLALLGKRAAMHELAHNLKDRPPKFR